MADFDSSRGSNNAGRILGPAGLFESSRGFGGAPPTPPIVPDTTPPVVDNYDPPQDTAISPTASVSFDVTDNLGEFHCIMITVFYPGTLTWEVIHTGTGFAPRFNAGSSRVPITNGYRYTVRRRGGWLSSPFQVFPFAVDSDGNENV